MNCRNDGFLIFKSFCHFQFVSHNGYYYLEDSAVVHKVSKS